MINSNFNMSRTKMGQLELELVKVEYRVRIMNGGIMRLLTSSYKTYLALLLIASTLIFFQNCSGRFNTVNLDSTGSNDQASSAPNIPSSGFDGVALYSQNCASCHMDLGQTTKAGRSISQITMAIENIPQMEFLKLSSAEIQAISLALSGTPNQLPTASVPTLPIGGVRVAVNSTELSKPSAFSAISMRRLTRAEIKQSLFDVLGVDPASLISQLPGDATDEALNPFDNDASLQSISPANIEAYDNFAQAYSNLFINNNAKIDSLAGCRPSSASDQTCFNQFASRVGRLLLRRPITTAELTKYKILLDRAVAVNNYYLAPQLLIQMFSQSPEFLYRIEVGQAVAGQTQRQLTDYEIASRLSFLIWGSAPDAILLDAAQAGLLKNENQRLAQADRMWTDARAKRQWNRFHAQWLGYDELVLPANLASDMIQETDQLIEKVNFSSSAKWMDLFSYNQTYVTPKLAQHYGMANVSSPVWVNYTGARGGGVLSHGRFLAQGSKFGDTSPTLRGYRILKRALCQKFGPVPVGVDTDSPPIGTNANSCKTSTYSMRKQTSCTACHALTDNIGFGLENFSPTGQWRTTEPNKPNCDITGEGSVGTDLFSGPVELGQNLSQNPVVVQCAMRQLLRYSTGRVDLPTDQPVIEAMHSEYLKSQTLKSIVLAMVKSTGFINK
jgi:hypothetical protein